MANHLQGDKYPGEQFSLNINMTDEMNQPASGFLQLDTVNINNQVNNYIWYQFSYFNHVHAVIH